MAMHIDEILAFLWMQQYEAPISVLLIRILSDVHLILMAAIMWSIMRRQNSNKHGLRVSLNMRLFTNRNDGPGKYQSRITYLFV